ncbi:IclR family transcriptional regulator [Pseudacidovorax sp. NFM-22]|uniref:IclR family transcriptional regulator n=1 Tax=Pseudacidovorax sp. NFM-22 TaxID=2744469 RepID=UPI001F1F411F|nr:IclR family transcriptional regulator [Pseudacidovorax sp. NFM-22]
MDLYRLFYQCKYHIRAGWFVDCAPYDVEMSQLNKVLQVLAAFTEARPTASAEEVAQALAIPRTTAFRYLGQLCESGLLAKQGGRYSLGPRIIQLDYLMRRSDPMLIAAQPVMASLAAATHCSVLLSSLFEDQIVNVHHEAGADATVFSYGRGRTLPLLRGAASMVILAHLPPARVQSICESQAVAQQEDMAAFGEKLRRVRKAGHYVSHGEVDPGVTGVAVPVYGAEGRLWGSLSLVFESPREGLFNNDLLVRLLQQGGRTIQSTLKSQSGGGAEH